MQVQSDLSKKISWVIWQIIYPKPFNQKKVFCSRFFISAFLYLSGKNIYAAAHFIFLISTHGFLVMYFAHQRQNIFNYILFALTLMAIRSSKTAIFL